MDGWIDSMDKADLKQNSLQTNEGKYLFTLDKDRKSTELYTQNTINSDCLQVVVMQVLY